jgi:hypothetical protein
VKVTLANGRVLTLPGCLSRFGAGFGIIGAGYELTHEIKRGRLWQVTGPAGCQREHLGIIDRIEV